MTAPADPPEIPTLQLLAAAAKAIDAGRSFQDAQDRMAEILATGPDEVEALRVKALAMTPADCTDLQPIAVSHGSERHQVFCGSCRWRGPIVGDRRSARQGFDADHGRNILDRLMPPEQCDLAHADRAMLHGRNMVPDERWNGMSS